MVLIDKNYQSQPRKIDGQDDFTQRRGAARAAGQWAVGAMDRWISSVSDAPYAAIVNHVLPLKVTLTSGFKVGK